MPDPTTNQKSSGGPDAGFGSLWRKRYWIELTGITTTPEALIAEWKRVFGQLWPGANTFYAPITGLREGELADLDLEVGAGITFSTGVRLLDSSATSYTLEAPPGHVFCGWTTFSAFERDGTTTAQVEVLMRASDPIFEIGLVLGGHHREDTFWLTVLTNLARHLGSTGTPLLARHCESRRFRIRNIGNIRRNAILRNGLHRSTDTLRRLTRRQKRPADPNGSIT